jgi:hypothetical protein
MRVQIKSVGAALTVAAASAGAQQLPPIRPLGAIVAKSSQPLNSLMGIRHLPGNRVLVNDAAGRKVVLFDSTLTNGTVVADSTSATANAYSGRTAGLLPYRGDSTLFVDPASMSMMVLDGDGKVARVMSVPRSQDAMMLAGQFAANAGFDPQGRLVYREGLRFGMPPRAAGSNPGMPMLQEPPESSAVLRVDLATRKVDTVGFFKIQKLKMNVTTDANGRMTMTSETNPLPVVDEWAVLSDGVVAFVRGRDYHVDFVSPDGSKTTAPKLPFEWQRLTDEDKVAFIDSVKAFRQRLVAAGQQGTTFSGEQRVVTSGGPPAGSPPPAAAGEQRMVIQMGPGDGRGGGGRGGAGGPNAGFTLPPLVFVSPSELPDYKPPFFAGAVRADTDGNLWIRTIPTRQVPGGPVYDVVNRKGELVDRVQIPAGRTIAGFGTGGNVYLTMRDSTGVTIERARVR